MDDDFSCRTLIAYMTGASSFAIPATSSIVNPPLTVEIGSLPQLSFHLSSKCPLLFVVHQFCSSSVSWQWASLKPDYLPSECHERLRLQDNKSVHVHVVLKTQHLVAIHASTCTLRIIECVPDTISALVTGALDNCFSAIDAGSLFIFIL